MAIEICPLAADVGNWADWAAVVVGIGAAIATTVVAVFAHRTSKRATEIAEEATKIAAQQHKETVGHRQGTAAILHSLLSVELSNLPAKLAAALHTMRKADLCGPGLIADRTELKWVLTELQESFMPTAESVQDKLHNFEGKVGHDIADLIGQRRAISDLCRRFYGRIVWNSIDAEVVLEPAAKDLFVAIRDGVRAMLKDSLETAPFFMDMVNLSQSQMDEIRKFAEQDD